MEVYLVSINLQAYWEPCQATNMELFAKIVNGWFSQKAPSQMIDRVMNTSLYSCIETECGRTVLAASIFSFWGRLDKKAGSQILVSVFFLLPSI